MPTPEDPYQPPRSPLESPQSIEARHVRAAAKYLRGAVAIGLLEVMDASIVASNGGAIGAFSYAVSFLELFWLAVSIMFLIRVRHPTAKLVGHAFVAYMVFGIVMGGTQDPSQPAPMPLIVVSGLFGLAYAIGSAYVGAGVWRAARGGS